MAEIVKDILNAFQERWRNPVTGTFFVAWLCWNWRFVLIGLIGPEDVIERIDLMVSMVAWCNGFVAPAFATVAYVVAVPALAFVADAVRSYFQYRQSVVGHIHKTKVKSDSRIRLSSAARKSIIAVFKAGCDISAGLRIDFDSDDAKITYWKTWSQGFLHWTARAKAHVAVLMSPEDADLFDNAVPPDRYADYANGLDEDRANELRGLVGRLNFLKDNFEISDAEVDGQQAKGRNLFGPFGNRD